MPPTRQVDVLFIVLLEEEGKDMHITTTTFGADSAFGDIVLVYTFLPS